MQKLLTGKGVAVVCDDLVHVHVGLGTAAGLPDGEREILVQSAGNYAICRKSDGFQPFLCHALGQQLRVHGGCRLLYQGESVDDGEGHFLRAYLEILVAALGLRAPIFVCGDADLAH